MNWVMVRVEMMRFCGIICVAVFFLGLMGCQSREMQVRHRRRADNIRRTSKILANMEVGRDEKLGQTLDYLERHHQRDLALTAENGEKIRLWSREEIDNWERQKPVIQKRAQEALEGDLPEARRTLPYVLD